MKRQKTIIVSLLILIIVVSGGFYTLSNATIRTVDFLTIFAIGALTGLLLGQASFFRKAGER